MDTIRKGTVGAVLELNVVKEDGTTPLDTTQDVTTLALDVTMRYDDGTTSSATWTPTSTEKGKLRYTTGSTDLATAGEFAVHSRVERTGSPTPVFKSERPYVFKVIE